MRLVFLVVAWFCVFGCGERQGEAKAAHTIVDNTKAEEPITLETGIVVPPGGYYETATAEGTQPLPGDTAATATIDLKGARIGANSGDAAEWSQALASLGILVWIGAVFILAGIVVFAIKMKTKSMLGGPVSKLLGATPWWLGPAISASGGALIAAPYFIEVATPWLVGIFVGVVILVIVLALFLAWKNRFKLEKKLNMNIAGLPGIGE